MGMVVPRNRELSDLLSQASPPDLNVLADLITDHGKGRVSLDSSIKAIILKRKEDGNLQSIVDVLETEIRAFGGNTIANLFRSGGVSYRELATDVANKLDGRPTEGDDVFAIEDIVIRQAIAKYGGDGAKSESLSGADLAAYVGQIVSSLVSASGTVVGIAAAGGAAGVASIVGSRLATLATPPLALVAMGTTVAQAVSPAFRITEPAVLQIAKIRRIRFESDFAAYTENLRACL